MSIPLDWLRPIEKDDGEEILASFADLQQTTRNTLYGNGHDDDKSPKGSVDAPIGPLVDLINRHSAICTLSSCSGRISLFDPNTRTSTNTNTAVSSNKSKSTEQSGKGRGGWVLVNHDLVDSSELLECFSDASNDTPTATVTTTPTNDDDQQQLLPWIFKLEPMLLHVAARSLKRGQELLRLALELGFRESGLVVTDRRVTVAIRSHSLSLALPLTPFGPLRPPNAYLEAVLEQANQRLLLNWKQLDRLYQAIESKLFRVSLQPVVTIKTTLPPLNLWNAATMAWPGEDDDDSLDIFSFAGYGTGPNASHPSSSSKRTSTIYQLSRSKKGLWSDQWEAVQLVLANETADQTVVVWPGGLEVSLVSQLPEAQGMTACRLEKWILLWGGRTSPSKSLDTIYLFDPETRQLATPKHVHGEAPPPRWGHSFVALSQNRMALTGGCNTAADDKSLDDFYILHFGPNNHFYWERVTSTPTIQLPTGRFHATTIVQEDDTLLVLGGLGSTEHALAPFAATALSKEGSVRACHIGETRRDGEQCHTTVRPLDIASPQKPRFGAAACTLGRLVVVSGGVESSRSSSSSEEEEEVDLPPLECSIVQVNSINSGASMAPVPFTFESDGVVDFGSLVHHSCLSISDREFLLLGGGVPSFAFGNTFATSYHVRIDLSCSERSVDGNSSIALEQPAGTTTKTKSTNKKSSPSEAKSAITNVLYVAPVDAKRLKSELESRSLLDKGFRMTKLSSGQIAVPVTVQAAAGKTFKEEAPSAAEVSWKSCIVGQGKEEMPFSTAQFAARGKR